MTLPAPPAPPAPPARPSGRVSEHEGKDAINAAMTLLGRRWMLRVLWELRGDPLTFRALQERCGGLSPTVLNQRLTELRDARLVASGPAGYGLEPAGRELVDAFAPLARWAVRWRRRVAGGDGPA